MKETAIHRRALQQAHRPGVRVWQDRLRTVARCRDRTQSLADLGQRALPRDWREPATALGADAPQRRDEAPFVLGALDVAIHLRAEESLREWMLRVAGDTNRPSILHGHEHRARVGTVVRTGAAHHSVARNGDVERRDEWGSHRGVGRISQPTMPRHVQPRRRRRAEPTRPVRRGADAADAQRAGEVTRCSYERYNKIENICCRAVSLRARCVANVLLRLPSKPLTRFHLALDSLLTAKLRNLSFTPPTGHPMRARTNASISTRPHSGDSHEAPGPSRRCCARRRL